ncbi:MAG TPA: DUF6600 domain-containing protein [Myxococcales bacterium]|nr:DUF6600 domain-containing protein [Myxococcales bacterium]
MSNPIRWCWQLTVLVAALFAFAAGAQVPGAPPAPAGADTQPPPPPEEEDSEEPPPPDALPPQSAPDMMTFERDLAPYGRWVDTADYGRVWIPNTSARSDWQPYSDGHWVYTQWGWSFVADVPWGWAPFHYGRWGWMPTLGWFWVPGFVWAPAWVSWRYTNGHVAWAPYAPPGFRYGRRWPGWVTVPAQHFTHPIERERIPRADAARIVRGARPAPSIQHVPERGRTYGPPRETGRPRGGGKPVAAPHAGPPKQGGGREHERGH